MRRGRLFFWRARTGFLFMAESANTLAILLFFWRARTGFLFMAESANTLAILVPNHRR